MVKFAKEHCIEMLTLPPHTSHELQPLDVSVFGPFKKAFANAQQEWYRKNPGLRISIHDIAGLSREPFVKTIIPRRISFPVLRILKYFHSSCLSQTILDLARR